MNYQVPAAVLVFLSLPTRSQGADLPPDFLELTLEGAQESMIAFVNLSTAPGLDGATFTVDEPARDSDLIRSSLGYAADFTLKDYVMDGYWGLALAYGTLEDRVNVIDGTGRTHRLDVDRDILSLRGSLGASLPIDQHFTLRPYLSVAASHLETDTLVQGIGGIIPLPEIKLNSEVDALTTSGTLVALYDRWYDDNRLEFSGQYTASYTDTFNGSNDSLETWGWTETALFRFRWSGATHWRSAGRSWRWNAFANHTRFLDLNKTALGFTYYSEFGLGMDYEWNVRPLDWFGLRYIGIKAGVIYGNDVEGFSVGLSF